MKGLDIRRFPAILCTNHQIYDEASSFFFSTLEIRLTPACVLSIALNSTKITPRLNPILKLDGTMTPNALASFKKVTFDIDFNPQIAWQLEVLEAELGPRTPNPDPIPRVFVDNNLTVDPNDAAKLLAYYRRSNLIHHFVNIVINSPVLHRLVITLYASVFSDCGIASDPDIYSDLDNYVGEPKFVLRHHLMTAVANERAMELLLDSGLLTPLEKLSNVRSFQFKFETRDRNGELYKPTAKHHDLLIAMKQKIERNYSVRTG